MPPAIIFSAIKLPGKHALLAPLLAAAGLVLASCSVTDTRLQPAFRPFADGKNWTLLDAVPYSIKATGESGEVPRGFVTDFASIPAAARGILEPYGRYGRAAVVHDYLYWKNEEPRERADLAFKELLEASGTPFGLRDAMYRAVRRFGQSSWNRNRKEWEQGLPRIIPEARIDSIPGDMTWHDFRLVLKNDGVEPRR